MTRVKAPTLTGTDLAAMVRTVATLYERGWSITLVATEVGRSRTWVRKALNDAGVTMRRPGRPPGNLT
jgi:hypothetical protein